MACPARAQGEALDQSALLSRAASAWLAPSTRTKERSSGSGALMLTMRRTLARGLHHDFPVEKVPKMGSIFTVTRLPPDWSTCADPGMQQRNRRQPRPVRGRSSRTEAWPW